MNAWEVFANASPWETYLLWNNCRLMREQDPTQPAGAVSNGTVSHICRPPPNQDHNFGTIEWLNKTSAVHQLSLCKRFHMYLKIPTALRPRYQLPFSLLWKNTVKKQVVVLAHNFGRYWSILAGKVGIPGSPIHRDESFWLAHILWDQEHRWMGTRARSLFHRLARLHIPKVP